MNSYYLTNHSRYIYIVISLSSLVVFMGVFFYIFPKVLCLQLYLLGLGLFGIYNLIQKVRNEHIIVSEKGIEYYAQELFLKQTGRVLSGFPHIGIMVLGKTASWLIVPKFV